MDDLEVSETNQLGSSLEKDENNEEVEDCFEDDAQSDGEEGGDKWIDVKDLKNMSLDELKTLSTDAYKCDADKRLDLPITKVVVRRLPPQITVQDYLQELSEVPSHSYIRLVPPNEDLPSRIGKRSSIYINFDTEQEAFWFKEKYNNMKFFDERGNSYISCVDFSFIQDIAQDPPDEAQVGTLEESEMYATFLKAYEEEPWSFTMYRPENIPTPEVMLDEILNKKITEPESTPLLQFLKERSQKKEASRKEREQRRKERDIARRKQKDELIKRRQKEKEEASRRKQREKEEAMKRKPTEEGGKDREKDNQRDRRRERDRERQRERDRERRLRREREKLEREQSNKNGEEQHTGSDKSSQVGKESTKQKNERERKQNTASGIITYSRSGNPTRWSENSGPRKGDKLREDHKRSQEQLNSTKETSSSDKLPVEKSSNDNQPSSSKTKDTSKSAFGKPFPTKTESGSTNKDSDAKDKPETGSGDSCNKNITNEGNFDRSRKEGGADGGTTKKRIVKRVIKVRKVKDNGGVENSDEVSSSQQAGQSESKPKKIIRVVKKSSKTDDGSSSSTKLASEASQKTVEVESKTEAKEGDTEKEKKLKKGRPEIQIYRPGSLRGASKSTSSSSADKERKSDNN